MSGDWSARATPAARATIFALSTPVGRSAVAVIRVSGPRSRETLKALTGKVPTPRHASLEAFRDPATSEILDRGLALWFPEPASFTGEDCAELHLHGSIAAIRAVLAVLGRQAGLREAGPGEFTRRALDNGKLDLARAEALADLIDAQTDRQRRLAQVSADAGPGRFAEDWQDRILDAIAAIDAELDFSDEGDVGSLVHDKIAANVAALLRITTHTVEAADRVRQMREGFVVAICGPPNSGKSTLLNALVGQERAIVSPYAGTTRDAIEVSVDIGGSLITFVDTAGIRDTVEPVERIGIERTRREAGRADLTIWLEAPNARGEPEAGLAIDLRVSAKADLGDLPGDFAVSVTAGFGLDRLTDFLRDQAAGSIDEFGDAIALRERHIVALRALNRELTDSLAAIQTDRLEIAAAHLRGGVDILGKLGPTADGEEVLDRIFSRFCIGK